jgi:thioredoxin-disulfide reductase
MKEIYDIIIVGAGPAGCTAAIYSARRNLKTLLIETKAIGGLFIDAGIIENYPGFEKISGIELAEKFQKQIKALPIKLVFDHVFSVKKKDDLFEIKTGKDTLSAKSVIIASGVQYKELDLKDEKKFVGRGISYCATCDAPLFQGKDVAVVGGGNSAFHYALYLSEICSKVYLIHKNKEFNAEEVLVSRLKSKNNVIFKNSFEVKELQGNKFLEAIKIKNPENGEEKLNVSGLFIAIGQEPKLDFIKDLKLELDEKGYIKVDEKFQTNIQGVFSAGDVTGTAGQIIIACGQGAKAALSASSYLKEK